MKKAFIKPLLLISLSIFSLTACSTNNEDLTSSQQPITVSSQQNAEVSEGREVSEERELTEAVKNIFIGKVTEIGENDITIQLAENKPNMAMAEGSELGGKPNMEGAEGEFSESRPENSPNGERPEAINPENAPDNSENLGNPEGEFSDKMPPDNGNNPSPVGQNNVNNIILTEEIATYMFSDDLESNDEITIETYVSISLNESGEVKELIILE